MRVHPYDSERPHRRPRPTVEKTVTPLRSISLGENRELRLSTVTSTRGASVAMQVLVRDHLGEMFASRPSFCIFAEQIPGVVAALTEAAAIFANPDQEPPCSTETPASPTSTAATGPGDTSEQRPSETSPVAGA